MRDDLGQILMGVSEEKAQPELVKLLGELKTGRKEVCVHVQA